MSALFLSFTYKMKRIFQHRGILYIILLFVGIILMSAVYNQCIPLKNIKTINISDTILNYGTLKTNTGKIPSRFFIHNLCDKNLVVLGYTASCPCINIDYCKDIIKKNDSCWIDVYFNTDKYMGTIEKNIIVKTTLGEQKIYVKGFVK